MHLTKLQVSHRSFDLRLIAREGDTAPRRALFQQLDRRAGNPDAKRREQARGEPRQVYVEQQACRLGA